MVTIFSKDKPIWRPRAASAHCLPIRVPHAKKVTSIYLLEHMTRDILNRVSSGQHISFSPHTLNMTSNFFQARAPTVRGGHGGRGTHLKPEFATMYREVVSPSVEALGLHELRALKADMQRLTTYLLKGTPSLCYKRYP